MRLINKTKIPDAVSLPILLGAARAVGARSTRVVVKLTHQNWGCSGMASRCDWVRGSESPTGRMIRVDGGVFTLRCMRPRYNLDGLYAGGVLALAENIFRLAMHEWFHVREYQEQRHGEFRQFSQRINGRRQRHDSRPEELRAVNACDDAEGRGAIRRNQDAIIGLACWYEQQNRT